MKNRIYEFVIKLETRILKIEIHRIFHSINAAVFVLYAKLKHMTGDMMVLLFVGLIMLIMWIQDVIN